MKVYKTSLCSRTQDGKITVSKQKGAGRLIKFGVCCMIVVMMLVIAWVFFDDE